MVGSGALLPVIFTVNSFSPYSNNNLFFKNILISNNMVKNSFYVCHFCIDKILYVEFDHFGFFFVKDIDTSIVLQRCDRVGDVYHVLPYASCECFRCSVPSYIIDELVIQD